MKLSKIKNKKILKDCEFDWLGLTAETYENKKVLTFLSDIKYLDEVKKNKTITGIITTQKIANNLLKSNYGLLISENPRKTFFELHNNLADTNFYGIKHRNKISSKAIIADSATLGDSNIIIEDNVIIEENVVIRPNTTIKKGSIIRANCVIGGNGFEFSRFADDVLSIKCIGNVIIEENVEIQYNTCVDRGVFGSTHLKKNIKINNHVHIAHDVRLGENTFVAASATLCGRIKGGKNSYFGPNCTVKNGLKIGDNSKISMGAVVTQNIGNNKNMTGNFAIEHKKFLKIFKKLLKMGE